MDPRVKREDDERVKREDDNSPSFLRRQESTNKMQNMKNPAVYILASKKNGTLYIGVTSDLPKRIYEHKNHLVNGFTKQYDVNMLVWYELHENMIEAIKKEKLLKKRKRDRKIKLIEEKNPNWNDLYDNIV
jgi:putative endonuclease